MSQIIGPEGVQSGGILTNWSALVGVADTYAGPYVVVPYLQPRSWNHVASPEISKATFTFDLGAIKPEDQSVVLSRAAIDLGGRFVRITLANNYGAFIAWQGVMIDMGLTVEGGEAVLTGQQVMTAYGLEYLLTKFKIKQAFCYPQTTQTEQDLGLIDWVPPFNQNPSRGTSVNTFGNRAVTPITVGTQTFYPFSFTRPSDGTTAPWDGLQAVEMCLNAYWPGDDLGFTFAIAGQTEMLENFNPTHSVGDKTIWEALDTLMPRQRGISFTVEHIDPPTIWVSSQFVGDIVVNGVTYPGNPEVYQVDFSSGIDIDNSTLFFSLVDRYRKAIIQGERIRSTFTADVGERGNDQTIFVPLWTYGQGQDYQNVSPTLPGDVWGDRGARDKARSEQDRFAFVYKAFGLNPDFQGIYRGASIFPDILPLGGNVDTSRVQKPLLGQGLMRILPMFEGYDYETSTIIDSSSNYPDQKKPFAICQLAPGGPGTERLVYLHDIRDAKISNLGLRMLDNQVGVNFPNGGHALAAGDWSLGPDQDQTLQPPFMDWRNMKATVCMQLDKRLTVEGEITGNPQDPPLFIPVKGAHCWVIHPFTVVDITEDGEEKLIDPLVDTYLRNDRDFLFNILALVQGWYQYERNLANYRIRGLFPHIPIGAMLKAAFFGGGFSDVNTLISKKTWRFTTEPTLTVQTGYAQLDVIGLVRQSNPGPLEHEFSGRVPGVPSPAALIRQVEDMQGRIQKIEDHEMQLPIHFVAGTDGPFWDHIHSGQFSRVLSRQRTKMADDDDGAKEGPFISHYNPTLNGWLSDLAKWL